MIILNIPSSCYQISRSLLFLLHFDRRFLHLFDFPHFLHLFSICFAILYFAKVEPLYRRPSSSGVHLLGAICNSFTSLDDHILHRISHEQYCKYIVTLLCTYTAGSRSFAECRGHSAKAQKHSAKGLPSVTLGKRHSATPLTTKASLPSVFCRTLGKDVAEYTKNTRQTFFQKKLKKDTRVSTALTNNRQRNRPSTDPRGAEDFLGI